MSDAEQLHHAYVIAREIADKLLAIRGSTFRLAPITWTEADEDAFRVANRAVDALEAYRDI